MAAKLATPNQARISGIQASGGIGRSISTSAPMNLLTVL